MVGRGRKGERGLFSGAVGVGAGMPQGVCSGTVPLPPCTHLRGTRERIQARARNLPGPHLIVLLRAIPLEGSVENEPLLMEPKAVQAWRVPEGLERGKAVGHRPAWLVARVLPRVPDWEQGPQALASAQPPV